MPPSSLHDAVAAKRPAPPVVGLLPPALRQTCRRIGTNESLLAAQTGDPFPPLLDNCWEWRRALWPPAGCAHGTAIALGILHMLRIVAHAHGANVALAVVAMVSLARGTPPPGDQSATPATDAAAAALAICDRADQLTGQERTRTLARGLELAEHAVVADQHDAKAHFAVFCNLGKLAEDASMFRQALIVGRLKHEIDSALALDPDDPQVLVAKGAFLVELPPFLGGDAEQGEALLRAALTKDPGNSAARRYLGAQ